MDWRERSLPFTFGRTPYCYGYYASGYQGYQPWSSIYSEDDFRRHKSLLKEQQIYALEHANWYYQYFSTFNGYEKIWSTKRGKAELNDCRHRRDLGFNFSFATAYHQNWVGGQRRFIAGTRALQPVSLPEAPELDWGLVDENLRSNAYHTMVPRLEGEVAMLNFLYELKDFRDIARFLFKGDRFARAYAGVKQHLLKASKDYTYSGNSHLATQSRNVAEGILIKNYAIDPTIKDVAALIAQAQQCVADAQEQFKLKGKDEQTRHFSAALTPTYTWTSASTIWEDGPIFCRQAKLYKNLFTASMSYTYEYKSRTQLEAFMRFYGLNPTFEIIWNAIPFSFLADYFVSIGHSLHVMDKDPNLVLNRHKYCESIKAANTVGYCVFTNPSTSYESCILAIDNREPVVLKATPVQEAFVCGITRSNYERFVCEPSFGPALPRFKIPSGKQALNMAALFRVLH